MIDRNFWKGKRVFVTGSTGFKGSWLCVWLNEMGARVTSYSLAPPTSPSLFELAEVDKISGWQDGDIRELKTLTQAIKKADPEIVFHLAAQSLVRESYANPVETYATNVMGSVNLLEAVRSVPGIRSVVMVTTDKCYENKEWYWGYREDEPMGGFDPYSSSKGCAELVTSAYRRSFFHPQDYGKKHTTAIASARAGNVIGGGDFATDRLIPDIIRAIDAGEQVVIRSPNAIRPWQHVLEPLSGYLVLAQKLYQNGVEFAEAWNFGPLDEDAKPVEWIVKTLCELWPGNKGYTIQNNQPFHEATYLKLDISKAKSLLDWMPRWNLKVTLETIVDWYCTPGIEKLNKTLRQIRKYHNE